MGLPRVWVSQACKELCDVRSMGGGKLRHVGLQVEERLVHAGERSLPTLLFCSGPSDWQGLSPSSRTPPPLHKHQKVPLTQTLYCTQVKGTQTHRGGADKEKAEGWGRCGSGLQHVCPVLLRRQEDWSKAASGWDGVGRLGSKPRLTSSDSKSSSSSSAPIRHSQIRSPHSSEFLQLPRDAVGRRYNQDPKSPPG